MNSLPFYQRTNKLYPVSQSVVDDAVSHAHNQHPNESCGVVYGDKYYPMTNAHEDPANFFRINVNEYRDLFLQYGDPQAVIHSHTKNEDSPSKEDMDYQLQSGINCGIVILRPDRVLVDVLFWGKTVPVAPYTGRPFISGVYDCYAILVDYYRKELNLDIKNYTRYAGWWDNKTKDDLFINNFAEAGFKPIDMSELKTGDVVLGKVYFNAKVAHCGVYLGDGTMYHHLSGSPQLPRLSSRDILYSFKRFITHSLRHESRF